MENKAENNDMLLGKLSMETIEVVNSTNEKYRVIPISFRDIGTNVEGGRTKYLYKDKKAGGTPLDYVRYRIMGQCAEEIRRKQVAGVAAEIGVFQGAFSVKLNEVLPDRLLYMYDTFEGL